MPLPAISVAAGVRTVSATAGRRPIRPVFPRAKAFLSHPVALPPAAGSTYRRGSGRGPACKAAQNSGSGVSSHPLAAEQGEDALPPCCRGKSEEVAEGEAVESVAVAPTVSEPPPARSKAVASAAAPAAAPSGSSYDTSQGLSMIGVGLAGLAVVGGIVYYGRKFLTTQVPEMQKAMEQRSLAKESQIRLTDFMSRLKSQRSCDLSAENLGEEGTQYIIEALAYNEVCTALDLSNNGIGPVGTAALAQALSYNDILQSLVMDTNNIGDEGAELLAKHVSGDMNIKSLSLSMNNIGDPGARALAEALKVNTTLETLELSGNVIDYEGAVALAEALADNEALHTLGLSDNYLGALGAGVLANALKTNKTLSKLFLKSNDLGDEGIKAVCEALAEGGAAITHLDIGNNGITAEGAEALATYLTGNKNIVELKVYMNDIGNGGMYKVAEAVKTCPKLEHFDISGNNFGEEGMAVLAAALKGKGTLKHLDVSYNPIGHKGATSLVDVAKYDLPAVEILKLGWCTIGGVDGAVALSDLIMYNTSMQTLDLRGNNLGDNGAIHLARGFRQHQNENFEELDLGYNEIKDDGACALAQALKANAMGSVRELKLSSNYITRLGQVALSEAVDMVYDMSGKTKDLTIHF
eukprot:jgi/Tetstr1/424606/TSEL_015128.t1